MFDKIHVWQFPYKTSVLLNDDFLDFIKKKIKQRYKKLRLFYNEVQPSFSFLSFKDILKPSFRDYRSLDLFVSICQRLKISLDKLEKNIIAYRTTRGHSIIIKPILPIQVTPLFTMIVAHNFADGCCIKIKNREIYFCYTQYNVEMMNLFINRVEKVFGNIKRRKELKSSIRFRIPAILSSILADYYNFNHKNFLSDRARLSTKMFKHSKEYLLAILIAFIIDEGNIDSGQIVISLHNKGMVDDLGYICKILGYEYSIKKNKERDKERYILYILSKGIKIFWKDYNVLKKRYNEMAMGKKEEYIKDFILRKNKLWRTKGKGETKNEIINLLKEKSRKINELAKILCISRQGIRFHIIQLEKLRIVERVCTNSKGDIFRLLKYSQFDIRNKGISRQKGVTRTRILKLLTKNKLSAKDLSKTLKIGSNTIRTFLYILEKENLVGRAGRRKVDQKHYTLLWKSKKI